MKNNYNYGVKDDFQKRTRGLKKGKFIEVQYCCTTLYDGGGAASELRGSEDVVTERSEFEGIIWLSVYTTMTKHPDEALHCASPPLGVSQSGNRRCDGETRQRQPANKRGDHSPYLDGGSTDPI